MASTKEIKNRIKSVQDTQKITGAMHLIAATKLQHAKAEYDKTRPYFEAVKGEIKRIFRTEEDIDSRYFYPVTGEHEFEGAYGYLVITADKGLAGAYNLNVIKEALSIMSRHDNNKLYVVGEYGRQYFSTHNIPIEKSFLYTAQNPTMHRAREMSNLLVDAFKKGELKKIFVIYTDYHTGMDDEACTTRLLPFHRANFVTTKKEKSIDIPFEFEPSMEQVLDNIIPSYVTGFIYSALVSGFCSEHSARMTAMDSANTNAEKLLDTLGRQYNHIRQSDITREITEIASGSRSLKRNAEKHRKE